MTDPSIFFSKNSDEWQTPVEITTDLGLTHNIAVDVACRSTNARFPVALTIDTGIDGLKFPWHQIPSLKNGVSCFCNPPHSTIVQWIEKVISEAEKGVKTVMLIPASTDTDHWHDLVIPNAVEIQEVKHRINFYGKIKVPKQPKDTPKEEIKYKMGIIPMSKTHAPSSTNRNASRSEAYGLFPLIPLTSSSPPMANKPSPNHDKLCETFVHT